MKAVVVYFSLNGHTKAVAEAVASKLGAELLRLEPRRAYPKSTPMQMVVGGFESTFGCARGLKPHRFGQKKYDLVVLASPIWAGKLAPPMRKFLKAHRLGEMPVGLVVCCAGGKTEAARGTMKSRAKNVVAELEVVDPNIKAAGKVRPDIDAFCGKLKVKHAV